MFWFFQLSKQPEKYCAYKKTGISNLLFSIVFSRIYFEKEKLAPETG